MAVPDLCDYTPNAIRVGGTPQDIFVADLWGGAPYSGAHVAAERTGSRLIPVHCSDTSPVLLPLFASRRSPAASAHQPVGTGSAQIRRSIAPNRRSVRWLSASRSQ